MSKVKDEYYKWLNKEHWQVKEIIQPYVSELEQNFETSESTLGFNTGVIIPKLEAEKAELIEFVEEVVFSLESYLTGKDWNRLEKAGLKLIEKNWVKS